MYQVLQLKTIVQIRQELRQNLNLITDITAGAIHHPEEFKSEIVGLFTDGDDSREELFYEKTHALRAMIDLGLKYHNEQFLQSGVSFLAHPLRSAEILNFLEAPLSAIIGTIGHDFKEENTASVDDISNALEPIGKNLSTDIVALVDAVTPPEKTEISYIGDSLEDRIAYKLQRKTKSIIKILSYSNMDSAKKPYLVKVSDRADNLRTLNHMTDPASWIATLMDTEMHIYYFAEVVDAIYQFNVEMQVFSLRKYLGNLVGIAKRQFAGKFASQLSDYKFPELPYQWELTEPDKIRHQQEFAKASYN